MARSTDHALTLVPASTRDIDAATRRCRKIVTKRALLTATAAVVPIPGIDLAIDIGVLMKMLQEINAEFGLTPEQIEALAPKRRLSAYKAIAAVGSSVIGRKITREALALVVKSVARRVATKTTARYVPIAGQALAATISFGAFKYIGDRHIDDCVSVAALLASPPARRRRAH
jgi:uncharacterized protein (DUF697 family)